MTSLGPRFPFPPLSMHKSRTRSQPYFFDVRHSSGAGPVIEESVINVLQELAGDDDPGLVNDLVELFFEDSIQRMQVVNTAVQEGDFESIARAAHALKSSSANVGALCFSDACGQLEGNCSESSSVDPETVERLVILAEAMYAEVCAAFGRPELQHGG